MSFYQNSVLNKHLKTQDNQAVESAYEKFTAYFHNTEIQKNIREAKEEQFQEGFLRELFVNVLGYTLNPQANYNLTTELKNERGAKKADGAILQDGKALGMIELKGTNTKNLDKINEQAFNYKNNQSGCVYVITSNFEKLRFFIHHSVEHIEFNLFKLTKNEFRLLWLCLSAENLLTGIPLSVKKESLHEEDKVTKQLYKDYAAFRTDMWQNMVKNNPEQNKLLLFKKTQKLLDRFLFVFFAEDSGLLPPNSISRVVSRWKILQDEDAYKPLYGIFKQYFGYINTGRKGKNTVDDIFAYNGGLFIPDDLLNTIFLDDDMLYPHVMKMTNYDFQSEVDVNILGHIFENSLSEIENITAELEGQELDKSKSKRKKDGVFYTPKYITKYIVENTVGQLCQNKKTDLDIVDEQYARGRRNRKKETVKRLDQNLASYRNWLLQLTICDPACGSGAFLNQALEFLIAEHAYIDELQAQLLEASIVFQDVSNHILEENIYGVDINQESVDIAKLSLWLRTAQRGRKLITLNNNLKCGNSLISDPAVAGEKAFDWQKEFPAVFKNGGFDVVIGNPPYVQLQKMGEMSDVFESCGYETFHKGADLYCIFTERAYTLLKNNGMQSFIMPNKWMLVEYGKPLRKFLSNTGLRQVLNFGDVQFFEEATTYICIFVTQKGKPNETVEVLSLNRKTYRGDFLTEVKANLYDYPANKFGDKKWSIRPYNDSIKLEQMTVNSIELMDLPISIFRGVLTGYNDAFFIDEDTKNSLIEKDPKSAEIIKPMIRGRDISPYEITNFEYLISTFPSLKLNIEKYPAIKAHLLSFGFDRLKQSGDKGSRKKTKSEWFETQDSISYHEAFNKPKIIYPNMTSVFPFVYDDEGFYGNDKSFILTANDDSVSLLFLTALFNSSLAKLWIWYNCPELLGGTREIRKVYFEHFPVPKASLEQTNILEQYAGKRSELTKNIQVLSSRFIRTIQRKFNIEKMSVKLQQWYLLSYAEFIKELRKKKVKLSLTEEAEWEDYFNQEVKKAQGQKSEIENTDKKINQMVYKLYDLPNE